MAICRLLLLALSLPLALAADELHLEIDTAQVLREGADRVLGINLNYLRDLDANRCTCARSMDHVLREMGVRWLRYPSGEGGEAHLFDLPPYDRAEPQALGGYAHVPGRRMDADAYAALCRTLEAEPLVVVGCGLPQAAGRTPEHWLEHAVAWVRYANITQHYAVKRWEISGGGHGGGIPAAAMARLVVRFSRAMKAVDPAIQVGAGGSAPDWWREFLPIAASDLDFLTVGVDDGPSDHPQADILGGVRTALAAVDRYAPAADRQRLRVVVDAAGTDQGGNTLGQALADFATLGALIAEPRIDAVMALATRGMGDEDADAKVGRRYALGDDNLPLPAGWALGLWGSYLHDRLVAVKGGSGQVAAWASITGTATVHGHQLTVWILNRGPRPVAGVRIALHPPTAFRSVAVNRYAGEGPDDTAPQWRPVLDAPLLAGDEVDGLACPASSLTVLTFGS